jgi:hypothetical protein
MGIRAGAVVGFGALFGLGALNTTGQSVKEGMMEAAFGSPDADRAFLGTELSGRFLAGSILGGPVGGLMRASAPLDYARVNPIAPSAGQQVTSTAIGGLVGGAVGGIGGTIANLGGKKFGAIGAIAGAAIGAAAPLTYTAGRIRNNQQFYSQSPYARSRQLANELNASGDIVLGMHNSRGGY